MFPLACRPKGVALNLAFLKRIKIPISASPDGELTDFQVRLTIVKGAGVNAAGTIYLQSQSVSWPYDIRFTASDGITPLYFWREESDDVDGTWVIKIPSIAAGGTTDIYLYYCSYTNADVSSIVNTAKDGLGSIIDGVPDINFWTKTGTPTVSKGPIAQTSGNIVSEDASKYESWPTVVRDSSGRFYAFYRTCDANSHAYHITGRVVMRTSDNEGVTWSDETIVANGVDTDDRDPGALIFDDNGVETILIAWCEQQGPGSNYFNIAYSKKAPISTMIWEEKVAIDGSNKRATHGNPVCLSTGRIVVPLFAYNDSGNYRVYSAYSDDGGDSWTSILVGTDNVQQPNEGSIIELKTAGTYQGRVYAIFRTEFNPYQFYKSESLDYGATWGALTALTFSNLDYGTAPEIVRLHDDRILFIYTMNKLTIGYVSSDECANWSSFGTILDRSATFELKHYCKAIPASDCIYVIWCRNLQAPVIESDVYFNKINLIDIHSFNAVEYYESISNVSRPAIVEARMKFHNAEATYMYPSPFGLGRYLSNYSLDCVRFEVYSAGKYCLLATTASQRSITAGMDKDLSWSNWRIIWAANLARLFDDGTQKGVDLTTNIPSADMKLNFGRTNYVNAANICEIAWVFVRKYTANEPAWAAPGVVEDVSMNL